MSKDQSNSDWVLQWRDMALQGPNSALGYWLLNSWFAVILEKHGYRAGKRGVHLLPLVKETPDVDRFEALLKPALTEVMKRTCELKGDAPLANALKLAASGDIAGAGDLARVILTSSDKQAVMDSLAQLGATVKLQRLANFRAYNAEKRAKADAKYLELHADIRPTLARLRADHPDLSNARICELAVRLIEPDQSKRKQWVDAARKLMPGWGLSRKVKPKKK